MPFSIVRNDITKMKVDAVVNAANECLQCGGGVCGAIFEAAGVEQLQAECDSIGHCETGKAVITSGYRLNAKYIIHTPGPVWDFNNEKCNELLFSCYTSSLVLAKNNNIESIAFPLISSGIYGCPKQTALKTAISAISDFLLKNDMTVYLVVFDRSAVQLSEQLFKSVKQYIDDNYAEAHVDYRRAPDGVMSMSMPSVSLDKMATEETDTCHHIQADFDLKDVIKNLDESFTQCLLRLIDESGQSDSAVYKKANIDRKLFSKIRSDIHYKPSKPTAISFAIALELSLDKTNDLLKKAGFALSHSNKADIIIEYFIRNKNYDIYEINQALFAFDQSVLGG